jgi:hypothetical protein
MAMGSPPQTSSMLCGDKSCDVMYIPPSAETTRPFGLVVRLVRSDPEKAVISVGGKQCTLAPGKAVRVYGVTVTLGGAPGAVVNLNFRRA